MSKKEIYHPAGGLYCKKNNEGRTYYGGWFNPINSDPTQKALHIKIYKNLKKTESKHPDLLLFEIEEQEEMILTDEMKKEVDETQKQLMEDCL
jgi:hypothetical protein